MTGRSARYSFFLLLFAASSFFGQNFGNPRVTNLLTSAFDSLKNGEYKGAYAYFDTLDKEFPQHAIGKIYKAGITVLEDYDYALGYDSDSLYDLIDDAIEVAEENYDNNPDELLSVYQYAIVLGLKGYYDALQKNYFSALSESIYSIQLFQECLEIDPSAYDAYVAIGSYKFWVSEIGKDVLYLPFIEDEREIGKSFLNIAIQKNTFHSYAAIHSLAYAYYFSKKYDKVIELLTGKLEKHPGNRIFGTIIADAYYNYKPEEAIIWYEKVIENYRNGEFRSNIREIELIHKIAQIYERLGKNDLALQECNNILEYKLNGYESGYLSGRLERVRILREQLLAKTQSETD